MSTMNILIIIVAIVGFIWFKFGRTILSIIQIIRHKDFTKNPKKTVALSAEQLKAISAGLIIAEQNMFYCDSLETGASAKEQSERLSSAWGIYSAESALERLSTFGTTHKLYDAAIQTYLNVEKNERENYIESHFDDEAKWEILQYTSELEDISRLLMKKNLAKDEQDLKKIFTKGSLAWDLGRIVYIARASYTVGYINESQAWQAINNVLPQVKASFIDWQEFGKSYLLGRAIWSHTDSSIDGLFNIYERALSVENNSPWVNNPL